MGDAPVLEKSRRAAARIDRRFGRHRLAGPPHDEGVLPLRPPTERRAGIVAAVMKNQRCTMHDQSRCVGRASFAEPSYHR
jgi:hypothetical protein